MITIISGTNRPDSRTAIVARYYQEVFQAKTSSPVKYFSLENLPADFAHLQMYEADHQHQAIRSIQDEYMIPAQKFFFVIPEYNGSFPGILKLFLDACSVREYKATFNGKKAAMAGVATGRAGNFRGMEHLTGILNHVGTVVMPNKLPISSVQHLLNEQKQFHDEEAQKTVHKQVDAFLAF
ncbi:MAG: NAD(P)H-dependent oxidoreductase [Bacteroidota bacterium]